jgi:diguanylate cyclase (GGDEF)-like protein
MARVGASDRHDLGGPARRRLMARIAAVFYVGAGSLFAVTIPLPGPANLNRPASLGISIAAIAIGVVAWRAPWDRWPRPASLVLVPPALALIGAGNVYGGSAPVMFGVFFVVVFVWVGLAHPPRTSLLVLPIALPAYVLPILALPEDPALSLSSGALVLPLCLLVGETVAWITRRLERIDQELRAKREAVGLLQDIAVAANEARTVDHALRIAVDRVCAHTGWPVGHAYLLEDPDPQAPPGRRSPRLASSGIWHLRDPRTFDTFRAVSEATRSGTGLPGRVLQTERPAWVSDLANDPTFLNGEIAMELGVRASFAFPVLIEREVVAVLEFFSDRPAEPDDDLIEVMSHVGAQLGRVIERRRAADAIRAEEIAHRALHDSLTGLPNMTLFTDRLTTALGRLARNPGTVAVMFLDLDRFKMVNDRLGHAAANELLIEVVRRVGGVIRPTDTFARYGGDEFVVLCEPLPGKEEALRIAGRVTSALAEPLEVGGRQVSVTASAGIALADRADADPEELLRQADIAMYRAKQRGRARYEVFDERMRAQFRGRSRIETALREALERDELLLYFQPVVRLADDATVGAEALVRWRHPKRGVLAAGHFLSVAEETGLIAPIDTWMIRAACRWLARWQDERGDAPFTLSVNLSARQFGRPDLAEWLARRIEEEGADGTRLCLEVTERTLLEDAAGALATVESLRKLGLRLAVDNFGTGSSSLGTLRRFPLDIVKIDPSVTAGLGQPGSEGSLVEAVLAMARALRLTTIAEGVETDAQADALRRLECDLAQGIHWSKPVGQAAFGRLVTPRVAAGT